MELKVFDIRERQEYLREVITLEHNEWASEPERDFESRINSKVLAAGQNLNRNDFCKLILLEGDRLVGFISIFPHDCIELPELTPWYATMYVKEVYRNKGYSKILNDAILEEARKRGFKTIYLKTELNGYYEKFGAKFVKNISDKEKLFKFDLD